MNYYDEYRRKLRSPEQAVRCIKSGDWIDYGTNVCFPTLLDKALAARRDELTDVKVRGNLAFGPIEIVESDPDREHFIYNSWHCSAYERKLCDKGLCNYIPMIFRNVVPYYRHFLHVNVAMMCATPMDRHGYFNLSCAAGIAKGILRDADIVILEINEHLPFIYGGFDESIHISEVDCVVEGEHGPLPEFPITEPTDAEIELAGHIVPYIRSGATLQLGIGSLPGVIGSQLAQSDVKDLGMHTELCGDAYYELFKAGKLTNRRKTYQPDKGVTGMVFGSQSLYDWVDRNPGVIIEPLEYVNAAETIAKHQNMISTPEYDLHQQLHLRRSLRTGQCRERRPAPHQRYRRLPGLSDGRSHEPRRQGLHLHDLHLQRKRRQNPFPDPAALQRGNRNESPKPELFYCHRIRRRKPDRAHYLGARRDADQHCAPRFPG